MAVTSSDAGGREKDVNFELGFNNPKFSDRVLRIEIAYRSKNPTVLSLFIRKKNAEGEPVTSLKVKSVHICSLMVAANSPFFHKLFENGMSESQKKGAEVTLRISAPEEAPFMDMLGFIYEKPLKATTQAELMDVLMVADKYEVISCMRHCTDLLLLLPMTTEQAFYILEFPPEVFVSVVTQPVLDAAKGHLSSHFSGFCASQQEEAMSLPLYAVEIILESPDFAVNSEEVLLDFMLKWARKNYPNLEERRDILANNLLRLICLSCLSYLKLMEIADHPDFDSPQVAKLVFKSLYHKIEVPHGPNSIPTVSEALLSNNALSNCAFPKRVYNRCRVVFFDIKKQDCVPLIPMSSRLYSDPFYLDKRPFSLFAQRFKKDGSSAETLGLFVEMEGPGSCSLNFEFSAKQKSSGEFIRHFTLKAKTFTELGRSWGVRDLLLMPWTELMGDDENEYMIDGVMKIRAQVTLSE